MKAFKRNAVILTVLLFVCAAVYLNWAYNKNEDAAETKAGENAPGVETLAGAESGSKADSAGLYYTAGESQNTSSVSETASEYFAAVRLSREQARDAACETLSAVTEAEGASAETVDAALRQLADTAEASMLETELEGLIRAKGFEECVVYISDGGVSVTVQSPPDGMSQAAVARITDAVLERTDFSANDLKIIEVK